MQADFLAPSLPDPQGTHTLPSIPSLPPIEIPQPDSSTISSSSGTRSIAHLQDSEDNQPSSAAHSEESYATACSSPLATPAEYIGADALDISSSQPAQSGSSRLLSKSLSVDSFVRDHQQSGSGTASPTDSMRTAGPSRNKNRLSIIEPEMGERWRAVDAEQRPNIVALQPRPSASSPSGLRGFASRVKRHSRLHRPSAGNRATEDEFDSSAYEDSELENGNQGSRAAAKARELRRRLLTPKRSGSTPLPGMQDRVQLPAPSRSRRLSSFTSTIKQPSPEPSKPTATHIAVKAAPLRSPTLRSQASAPTSLASPKSRRQSSEHRLDDPVKRSGRLPVVLHIDTENLSKPDTNSLTIAVIGARRCGKSSFIRRAWRGYHIDSATEQKQIDVKDGSGRVIKYVCRKAYMSESYGGKDCIVRLVEVRVEDLLYPDGKMHGTFWPTVLPRIDAAYILYDASERRSFDHVEFLIRGCRDSMLPFIVLACKSDLERIIPPAEAAEIAAKYDGGIVEISSNEAGKDKAHRCVGVILRGVMRMRHGDVDPNINPCSPNLHGAPIPMPWDKRNGARSPPPSSITLPPGASKSKHITSHPSQSELPSQPPPPHGPLPLPPQSPPPQSPLPALPSSAPVPLPPSHIRDGSVSTRRPSLPQPHSQQPQPQPLPSTTTTEPHSPTTHLQLPINTLLSSPTRARSMNDITQRQKLQQLETSERLGVEPGLRSSRSIMDLAKTAHQSVDSLKEQELVVDAPVEREVTEALPPPETVESVEEPLQVLKKEPKQVQTVPWASLEELFDKLFFLAVSGDDPSFISHFFLTYRRFSTPRRVLLAMQKRMLDLSQSVSDYTLAFYAQMRICNLLEQWTQDYPNDFAVPGSAGALNALIKQILRQTHTLYYGSDLLPFIEMLHTLQDLDGAWAVPETSVAEDDSDSAYDIDGHDSDGETRTSTTTKNESVSSVSGTKSHPSGRDRKASLPLSAKAILQVPIATVSAPAKDLIARLVKASNNLLQFDSDDVAKEITRRELELYMDIKPRDWLRHTLVSGKKDPNIDTIARFNSAFNELHDWAASMILCHDKPKSRARVIEKLADVAVRLRNLNNYSGLRAVITAITQSTYPNDEVMDIFKTKNDLYKKYLSSDILMRTAGAHQSYRLALRNTKGPCIPCLEVHTSDLRRAHEGNPDYKPDDPEKVHWAKFSMIGKFVNTTTQLQAQCRTQPGYEFVENVAIGQLFDVPVMDYDMQQDRLGLPPADESDSYGAPPPPLFNTEHSGTSKEPGLVKRLLFWSM